MTRISTTYKLMAICSAAVIMTACSAQTHMHAGHNHGHAQTQSSAYGSWSGHPPASRYGTFSATSNCQMPVQCAPMVLRPIAPLYPAQTVTHNYNSSAPAVVYTQAEPTPYVPDYEAPPVYEAPSPPITLPYSYPAPAAPEPMTWKPAKK